MWEYLDCIEGYNEKMRADHILWGQNILYTGNLKKGTKLKDILGYDPYGKEDKTKYMNNEEWAEWRKETNKIMPPLDAKGLFKLRKKIRQANERK